MILSDILYLFKRSVFKVGSHPAYFLYFITGKCQLKCQHCFYHLRDHSNNELRLEEIEKFSRSMGRIPFLLLTGGEPFLYGNFEKVPEIFYRNNGVRTIAIPTNGYSTDIILQKAEKMLQNCPEIGFTINVSLDGIGPIHDKIRQREGSFVKAVETCKKLVVLRKTYKNFDVGVCTVISSLNQHQLREIYDFVSKDLDIRIWAPFLTRGFPRNPETALVDMELYKNNTAFMKNEINDKKYKEYTRLLLSPWHTAKNAVRRNVIYKIKTQNKRSGACYAGRLMGVMFPNGEIKPCELREETFGNIRDFNYDFSAVWTSEKAEMIRKKINSEKCFCTHECFLTMNLFFNPLFFLRLAVERLRIAGLWKW